MPKKKRVTGIDTSLRAVGQEGERQTMRIKNKSSQEKTLRGGKPLGDTKGNDASKEG